MNNIEKRFKDAAERLADNIDTSLDFLELTECFPATIHTIINKDGKSYVIKLEATLLSI